jgi:CheY-like chemotaxis protein
MRNNKKKLLLVDDDKIIHTKIVEILKQEEFKNQVLLAGSCGEALKYLKREAKNIRVVIADCHFPLSDTPLFLETDPFSGKKSGLELCKYIRETYPYIKLAMFSGIRDAEIRVELIKNKIQFIPKPKFSEVCKFIKTEISHIEKQVIPLPNIFIVHGHAEDSLSELKNYIQNVLKLGYPVILKEKPNEGLTIIEKFEKFSADVDIAFVLLTPDDTILVKDNKKTYSQARPNAIFELGYFMGSLSRKTGRVIPLRKSQTNIFSDIEGIISIDISNGILNADKEIRNELKDWL